MKKSNYNFFYQYDGDPEKMIAYNSRTCTLATINKEDYNAYTHNLLEKEELVSDLKKGGFLIDDKVDELKIIQYNLLKSRYGSHLFALTIAPTLDCDFACVYCYEKGKRHGYMSKEVQDAIIKSIRQQAKTKEGIRITWHGGEPMLALNVIENITKPVLEICEEHGADYSAGMITNGYNLTRENVLKFKDLKINFIQVTLDGTENIHNFRRPLRNGGGTFKQILENLKECKDILPRVSIRVNVDKENEKDLLSILQIIKEYEIDDIVSVYPGYVEPTNDCYSQGSCLTLPSFSKIDFDFNQALLNEKLVSNTMYKYPSLKSNACGADNENSFVIDPEGDIYKCWSDIGRKEYKINNILESQTVNKEVLLEYMLYDATTDEECKNCKLLPICMGGCPRRRIDKVVDRCSTYKYVLEDYINQIAHQKIMQGKNKHEQCECL